MMIRMIRYATALLLLLLPITALAMTAEEVARKSQEAYFYQGKDFKSRVLMRLISKGGQERTRELAMIRKSYGEPGGEQKFFMYFFQPADVKDMTFMVYKYPSKDSDRWLFIPSVNMVRRIAASDKTSSFVGSDFTYEDVSGRNLRDDGYELVKEEKNGDKDCFVLKSTPKAGDMDYNYRLSWIDKGTFLPLKEEYYDKKGEIYKKFSSDEIKDIKGFPTMTKRTMENVNSGHVTKVEYLSADYNIGVEDTLFSERYLKQPPKKLFGEDK
ncbi:MAG: outer membrane lipoprotein-sorting protein [Nitrospirae bacterium]|nr:outer membrane lipoprotein-sorting protein [Nitrospirota bacterium]